MINLSKSKYIRYCQFPKMLWLDTYYPELAVQDEALQRRFQEGKEVGDFAMGLLGKYVETTAYTAEGKLDIHTMLKNTKKYLIESRESICEAAFTKKNCYCAVDILHQVKNDYEINEVKSSTDIPDNVCVLAYNKGFECGRIPELAEKLLKIRDNIRDLLDVFRDGYVYDRAMGGSFSIKKVLPALFPNDPNLDYHNLMDVHNGGEATDTFLALRGMEKEECERLRQSLLAYCGLDTLAMVMLWQSRGSFVWKIYKNGRA